MENLIKTRTISCDSPKFNMMVGDIKGILKEINPNTLIVEIDYKYNENLQKQIEDTISSYTISTYNKHRPVLFCAVAYVSTEEFPESEYYLEGDGEAGSKKPLPIKEVLERDSKVFIDCGFININNWINYEHKIAFLYPNNIGQEVYKVIQKLNLEKELRCFQVDNTR